MTRPSVFRTFFGLTASLLAVTSPLAAPAQARKAAAPATPNRQVSALFDAAEKGDTGRVRALLDAGVSAKSRYPSGFTPLLIACVMDHPATVKLLLERGADPNVALAPGAYISGSTPLILATDIFVCIMAGAKLPDAPAGLRGHEIQFMKSHPDRVRAWEAKTAAWEKGYGVIVGLLLDHGADVNARTVTGMTAIGSAATSGETDTVRLLLERGARLDLPTHEKDPSHPGRTLDATNGYFALAGATSMGRHSPEMVKLLLAHGANPNAKSTNDMTPLGRASESGDAETVRLLLAAGADVNAGNPFGHTALGLARRGRHAAVVALLLGAGAKDSAPSAPPK